MYFSHATEDWDTEIELFGSPRILVDGKNFNAKYASGEDWDTEIELFGSPRILLDSYFQKDEDKDVFSEDWDKEIVKFGATEILLK